MKPFNILYNHKMMDWGALLYGMEEGHVTLHDINNYAQDLLDNTERDSPDFYSISLIASSQDWTETKDLVKQLSKTNPEEQIGHMSMKKWQFAFLKNILESTFLKDHEKIERIQSLYSDLLYPENMRNCSIYTQNKADPIEECKKIIHQLDEELSFKKNAPKQFFEKHSYLEEAGF